jgi:hypothetical protein
MNAKGWTHNKGGENMEREAFEAMMEFFAGTKPDEIHYGFGLRVKDAQLLDGALTIVLREGPNPEAEALRDRLREFLNR